MEDHGGSDDVTWSTVRAFGPKLTQDYDVMALGKNGLLYALSYSKSRVLEIDAERKQVREIGKHDPLKGGSEQCGQLVASSANGCLYAPHSVGSRVVEIDPAEGAVKMLGPRVQESQYVCMVEATDGCLYAPPCRGSRVLKVNPLSGMVQQIGDAIPGGYWTAVVANNGRIYSPPGCSEHVLEIEPDTNLVRCIGEAIQVPDGSESYSTICAAQNGLLYAPPDENVRDVLEIDPAAGSVRRIALDQFGGLSGFNFGCRVGSGHLYFASREQNLQELVLLRVDPSTAPASVTTHRVAEQLIDGPRCPDAVYNWMLAGAQGNLYLLPSDRGCVLEINPTRGVAREIGPTLVDGCRCPVQVGDCIVAMCGLASEDTAQALMISHHALQPQSDKICAAWGSALASGTLSDVTVRTSSGKEHRAHKLVLSLRSSVFDSMFRAPMREAEDGLVLLGDVSDRVANIFLQFLYTGNAGAAAHGISIAELCELSAMAHKYEVSDLLHSCSVLLSENLRPQNAASALRLADTLQLAELKQRCLDCIVEHPEVMETDAWAEEVTPCHTLAAEVAEALGGFRRKRRKVSELEFPASTDWSKLTVPKLRRACAERGLAQDGKKESLLERLRE
mmetsp:Transcript_61626/g.147045  ORF Transcript_61626/g.147045 Transcript_61626/m.147045 type:complete len:619 (+) Transcript_61626:59-1915(+)